MKSSEVPFKNARRHLGVALIDLDYALTELAKSLDSCGMAKSKRAALDLLSAEVERLAEVATFIDRIAQREVCQDHVAARLRRWWPELVRETSEQPLRD